MVELIPGIRNAVRAIILREEALLLQHKVSTDGLDRFTLPGGAPNLGETLEEGLQRECIEEIGTSVEVVELMHVADFYKIRKTAPPSRRQQVEFLFRCHVPDDYQAQNGSKPDKHQKSVVWMPLNEIREKPLFPEGLKKVVTQESSPHPVYLGLIQ